MNHIVDIFGIGWLLELIAQGLIGTGGGGEDEPYCRYLMDIFGMVGC